MLAQIVTRRWQESLDHPPSIGRIYQPKPSHPQASPSGADPAGADPVMSDHAEAGDPSRLPTERFDSQRPDASPVRALHAEAHSDADADAERVRYDKGPHQGDRSDQPPNDGVASGNMPVARPLAARSSTARRLPAGGLTAGPLSARPSTARDQAEEILVGRNAAGPDHVARRRTAPVMTGDCATPGLLQGRSVPAGSDSNDHIPPCHVRSSHVGSSHVGPDHDEDPEIRIAQHHDIVPQRRGPSSVEPAPESLSQSHEFWMGIVVGAGIVLAIKTMLAAQSPYGVNWY